MRPRALLIVALATLAGCTAVIAPRPMPNIYVMRHLHTPKGVTDPDLTAEGRASAAALAQWLSRDPPNVIFVSNTKRAQQTAAPTAHRYRVTPHVYDPAATPGLISAILGQKGTVLVVGHSNTVPDIVAGLGGERPTPLVHEDFGGIWHIQGSPPITVRAQLP